MSYPDDPSARQKANGYAEEQVPEKVPTPANPNPAPAPDVRPPSQSNLPARREQLTPEQIAAHNKAIQQRQAAAIAAARAQQQAAQQQAAQQQAAQQQAAQQRAAQQQAAVQRTQPAVQRTQPAVQQTQPAVQQTQPAVQRTQPAAQQTQPAVQRTQPAVQRTQPAVQQTQPAVQRTQPAVQQNLPSQKTQLSQPVQQQPTKKRVAIVQKQPVQRTQQTPPPQRKQTQVKKAVQPAANPKPQPQTKQPVKTTNASTVSLTKESEPKTKVDTTNLEFVSGSELEATHTGEKLLDTDGLVKIYDGRKVVDGVAINVRKGEIVGLLGPNGAGKTTSFYMIVGLVPPNGGTVMFNGVDVTRMPMYKRARLGMGYLPQEESIFRKLTVEENIMAVMQTMKYSRKEKKQRCEELLEKFSITHIRKNIAMACSGGEKRRVTIARSLVPNPSLIMLDEPFAGVDPIAVNEIQGIVEDLRKEGLAILLTDHNARQTLELVDRAYLIYEGKVLREGSQEFLVNDPVSRELYLGDRFTM